MISPTTEEAAPPDWMVYRPLGLPPVLDRALDALGAILLADLLQVDHELSLMLT